MTDRQRRVAATFISRYFELLIVDPQQLVPMYLPKAQFNHDGPTKAVLGPEAISKSLARLYPEPNHGRVSIHDMTVRPTERGRFAVIVSGKYTRRGRSGEGETFRHVLELQEHNDSNGVFGIYADTRHESKQEVLQWALETPPMDAKPEPVSPPPALIQPPATEAPKVAATPAAAAVVEAAPPAVAAAAPSGGPVSFADILRNKAPQAPRTTAAPAKAKDEAKADRPKSAKKSSAATGSSDKKSEGAAANKKPKDGEAAKKDGETGAPRAAKRANRFDIIVKGLPTDAERKFVADMFACPLAKVLIRANADKKDPTITRTFAFVLVDREGIVKADAAADVDKLIAAAIKSINTKYVSEHIQAEVVREKIAAAKDAAAAAAPTKQNTRRHVDAAAAAAATQQA